MFEQKQQNLFSKPTQVQKTASVMDTTNPFLNNVVKNQSKGINPQGSIKLSTTGSAFVDQFAKATDYRKARSFQEISADMSNLWAKNPMLTLALTFYFRMITRMVTLWHGVKTSTTQRGQGLKHEGVFRMIWIAVNQPTTFWKNIPLFIAIGSWKDIIVMLSYDLQYNGWKGRKLDWDLFGKLILAGLENPNSSELLKKYLPTIRPNSKCNTLESQADNIIAKWICSLLFGAGEGVDSLKASHYKKYRKLKSSGTAHEWQQLISQNRMFEIDFNTIHGRALAQLVSGKFLANNKLEDAYQKWIEQQPVAKYTGYVYELLAPVKSGYSNNSLKKYQEETINKQFYGLLETAKKGMNQNSSLLVVVDSSSSMTAPVPGTKVSSYDVAKAMALFFSYLLKGPFEKAWMEFNGNATLKFWKGNTPVENLQNDRSEAYGSTDLQSVTRVFMDMKRQGVEEEFFPTGILCVSDGCFNSTGRNQSNYDTIISGLKKAGFSSSFIKNFKVIFWDIPNNYYGGNTYRFEDFADREGLFHMSGLDPAAVAFITGVEGKDKPLPKSSEELFLAAMDQEVLNLLEI